MSSLVFLAFLSAVKSKSVVNMGQQQSSEQPTDLRSSKRMWENKTFFIFGYNFFSFFACIDSCFGTMTEKQPAVRSVDT